MTCAAQQQPLHPVQHPSHHLRARARRESRGRQAGEKEGGEAWENAVARRVCLPEGESGMVARLVNEPQQRVRASTWVGGR